MLVKCESKSPRVKGVSFHPRLAWVLISLHNGAIHLWDYRIGCLIEKFEEHSGPVRGIHFHPSQQLFVSGGDDSKIRVWEFKQKRSLFALKGHLDYIRTVQFHNEYPWVCSASDDQTVRIWNWQSRHCLAVLASHHHYVMCATFHPTADLLASASLDQTIRIWDLSGLREKTVVSSVVPLRSSTGSNSGNGALPGSASALGGLGAEYFGVTDAVCKFVIEGHDRGVNWVSFHPKMNLIASCADDRQIKLWRYDDLKWWESDTLRGHFNNVSCVIFHPLRDLLISNSEDRTIRVWDLNKRTLLQTYRRDSDRFWILGSQPSTNLLAAGHDTGMVVFKLERERPAAHCEIITLTLAGASAGNLHANPQATAVLIYIKNGKLGLQADAIRDAVPESTKQSETDESFIEIAKGAIRKPSDPLNQQPAFLFYNSLNSTECIVSLLYKAASSIGDTKYTYDLLVMSDSLRSMTNSALMSRSIPSCDIRTESGHCNGFAFCGRNRFVTIGSTGDLYLHTITSSGESITKSLEIAGLEGQAEMLFFAGNVAGNSRMMIRTEETLFLVDILAKKVIARASATLAGSTLAAARIRRAYWSPDGEHVALCSKHHVTIARGSDLARVASTTESVRVKSGAWDDCGGFVYSTLNHLKYLLVTGDQGVFRSIPENAEGIYLQAVRRGQFVYLTRQACLRRCFVNTIEEQVKIALSRKRLDEAAQLLRHGPPLRGHSWVGYLRRKGYPEIAFHCATDNATRALLAIECADLQAAQEAVGTLNSQLAWSKLGNVALKLGNTQIAEKALQKSRMYHKLIHLYLLTGNIPKLNKLAELLRKLGHTSVAFHITLTTGNIPERVSILAAEKKYTLAYTTAVRHGFTELAESLPGPSAAIRARINSQLATMTEGRYLCPPMPSGGDQTQADWPLVTIPDSHSSLASGVFDLLLKKASPPTSEFFAPPTADGFQDAADSLAEEAMEEDAPDTQAWGEEDDWFGLADAGVKTSDTLPGSGAKDLEDLNASAAKEGAGIRAGVPVVEKRVDASLACTQAASGDFAGAYNTLNRRLGLSQDGAEAMKPVLLQAFLAANTCVDLGPVMGSLRWPLLEKGSAVLDPTIRVHKLFSKSTLQDIFKSGTMAFSSRKLEEAKAAFLMVVRATAISFASDAKDEQAIKEHLTMARHYLIAIMAEQAQAPESAPSTPAIPSDSSPVDARREIELALVRTVCAVMPVHRWLLHREALRIAVRRQNYVTGALIGQRAMAAPWLKKNKISEEEIKKQRVIVQNCEAKATNAVDMGDVDLNAIFSGSDDRTQVCAHRLKFLRLGEATVTCNLCGAVCGGGLRGTCPVCGVTELGKQVLGLQLRTW